MRGFFPPGGDEDLPDRPYSVRHLRVVELGDVYDVARGLGRVDAVRGRENQIAGRGVHHTRAAEMIHDLAGTRGKEQRAHRRHPAETSRGLGVLKRTARRVPGCLGEEFLGLCRPHPRRGPVGQRGPLSRRAELVHDRGPAARRASPSRPCRLHRDHRDADRERTRGEDDGKPDPTRPGRPTRLSYIALRKHSHSPVTSPPCADM